MSNFRISFSSHLASVKHFFPFVSLFPFRSGGVTKVGDFFVVVMDDNRPPKLPPGRNRLTPTRTSVRTSPPTNRPTAASQSAVEELTEEGFEAVLRVPAGVGDCRGG